MRIPGRMQLLLHFAIDEDSKTKHSVLSDYTSLFQLLLSNVILIRIEENLGPLKFRRHTVSLNN